MGAVSCKAVAPAQTRSKEHEPAWVSEFNRAGKTLSPLGSEIYKPAFDALQVWSGSKSALVMLCCNVRAHISTNGTLRLSPRCDTQYCAPHYLACHLSEADMKKIDYGTEGTEGLQQFCYRRSESWHVISHLQGFKRLRHVLIRHKQLSLHSSSRVEAIAPCT